MFNIEFADLFNHKICKIVVAVDMRQLQSMASKKQGNSKSMRNGL